MDRDIHHVCFLHLYNYTLINNNNKYYIIKGKLFFAISNILNKFN